MPFKIELNKDSVFAFFANTGSDGNKDSVCNFLLHTGSDGNKISFI